MDEADLPTLSVRRCRFIPLTAENHIAKPENPSFSVKKMPNTIQNPYLPARATASAPVSLCYARFTRRDGWFIAMLPGLRTKWK